MVNFRQYASAIVSTDETKGTCRSMNLTSEQIPLVAQRYMIHANQGG